MYIKDLTLVILHKISLNRVTSYHQDC